MAPHDPTQPRTRRTLEGRPLELSAFWSILPGALEAFAAQLAAPADTPGALDTWALGEAGLQGQLTLNALYPPPAAGPAADAAKAGLPISLAGPVAVIPVTGVLFKRDSGFLARFFGMRGMAAIKAAIKAAVADAKVRAIALLPVDSPGGTVDGLHDLADTILDARQVKPVVAQVDGTAASAAYWLASQATEIFVNRGGVVGSIGVRMALLDASRLFANAGVEVIPIDTGKFKSAGLLGTEITEEQKAHFQAIVDSYMDDFVDAVAAGRGITKTQVRAAGDGRMFRADEAQGLGLIDGVAAPDQTLLTLIQTHSRARPGSRRIL